MVAWCAAFLGVGLLFVPAVRAVAGPGGFAGLSAADKSLFALLNQVRGWMERASQVLPEQGNRRVLGPEGRARLGGRHPRPCVRGCRRCPQLDAPVLAVQHTCGPQPTPLCSCRPR